MAQGWYDHDWVDMMIEIEELKKRKLKPGAKVFDIGAHQGVVALLLSRAIGPDGLVVAVEADPWNARAAEINRKLNKAANIRVLNAAAGETDRMPDHKAREGLDRVFDWS
jgi:precorrin-6B methylase 2